MGCFEILGQINYLAVVVCTVIATVLGALWYSKLLFGNAWMKGIGLKEEDVSKSDSTRAMIVSVILAFIMAVILASFLIMTGTKTFWRGVHIGALIAVGFMAMVLLMNTMFEKKSLKVWLIHSLYHLVYFMINGGILAIWN